MKHNFLIGTNQQMSVIEKKMEYYTLKNEHVRANLPIGETEDELEQGETVDVFLFQKNNDIEASLKLPEAQINEFGWGEIADVIPHLGAFINIGTAIDILISSDDLPKVRSVWPVTGEKLYVRLKKDSKNRLFAVPAREREFSHVITDAEQVELNEQVEGQVIRTGKEGTVILTKEYYRGFIHFSERKREPRLGEFISGRVIEVKEDGTLNISLLPLKHERIDDDAEKIFAYIEANDGIMPLTSKSDPEVVMNTFGMSKAAFKRAVGRLLKEGKIDILDNYIQKRDKDL